ncbi:hypothetical protein [Streptomyces sp. BRA346]|uniref:hypothetical protein n=1 Tax=Streptomyces sp. BRA346 TaxID=2878199 RepID=UPI0040631607
MANTRRLNRTITTAQAKLEAVQRRETWPLTAGEQARLAAHGAVILAKGTRLKTSRFAEDGIKVIWAGAESRFAAEVRAAKEQLAAEVAEAAAAKVAKKGRW